MKITIEITGLSPLLMNRFDIESLGKKSDKGLSPREEASKKVYQDEKGLYIPSTNIYSCIMDAGRFHKDGKVKITTAKSSMFPAGVFMDEKKIYFKRKENKK